MPPEELDGATDLVEGAAPEGEVEEQPFTLPEDFATQVQSWEVPVEQLPQAVQLYKTLQTEEGVIDNFIRLGQNLGFGLKDMEKLFAEEQPVTAPSAVPAAPAEPEDPDRLMTAAEVNQLLGRERAEREQHEQQRQQAELQSRQRHTFSAIDQWFGQQGITDEAAKRFIVGAGERTILPGQDSYDVPTAIAALEKGKAEYENFIEKQAQAYIAKKGTQMQSQPTHVGGGNTAGGEGEETPDYSSLGNKALDTAKARVRKRLTELG